MDWFSRITGILEADYDKIRARLEVNGSALHSKANGRSYSIGDFELASLEIHSSDEHRDRGQSARLRS